MSVQELYCDSCAAVREFEQPPCVDQHDPECPEWVCTGCGGALVTTVAIMLIERRKRIMLHKQAA